MNACVGKTTHPIVPQARSPPLLHIVGARTLRVCSGSTTTSPCRGIPVFCLRKTGALPPQRHAPMNSRTRTPFGNSPPDEWHLKIPADKLKPGRVFIVGDVHGCLDELDELLEEGGYEEDNDNLILAGDIVNKGPKSLEVLRRARELNALVVRGNHEDACLALRKRLGVVAGFSSSYRWLTRLTPDDVAYLEKLPFTISLPSHSTIVVHAGFVPDGTPVHSQTMKTMLFLEDVEEDGKKFKCHYKTRWENKSWARHWQGSYHAFYGHASGSNVQKYKGATGLDTGCVAGGKLTACILPSAADLQQHEPYRAYLESARLPSSPRAPTLEELGAELVQVYRSGQQNTLQTAFSEDLCGASFARPEEEGNGSMREIASTPVPAALSFQFQAKSAPAATQLKSALQRRSRSAPLHEGCSA